MKNLKPMHIKVLNAIADYPQGLLLSQIQQFVGIKNKQLTLYYLNFLIQKEYLEKRQGLYFAKPHAGSAIPFTQPTQRPHAFRGATMVYKSHMAKAKASMEAIGLHPEEKMKGSYLQVYWRSIELKLWKNGRLEHRPSLPEYPLNTPLEAIRQKAAHETAVVVESFLSDTGLKCLRDRLGRLAIEITYWENGYPKNEIARESTEQGEKKVYAYDRETGKEAVWADNSLNPFTELETNKAQADREIKALMQGIVDGEIKPYHDEIQTRRELERMDVKVDRLEAVLEGYAKQIELHLGVMKQIDKRLTKLNQKRLFE